MSRVTTSADAASSAGSGSGPSTSDLVLDAVSRIIERREHDLPGVAEIAREARVSRPTFYAYFASSEEAVSAVVGRVRNEVRRIQKEADLATVEAMYRSTLVALLDLQVRHVGLFGLLASQARLDDRMAALWHDIFDRPVRRHARFIDDLVAQGLAEPVTSSIVVAEAMNGVTTRFAQLIAEDPSRRDELAEELVALQQRLIGLPPGPAP